MGCSARDTRRAAIGRRRRNTGSWSRQSNSVVPKAEPPRQAMKPIDLIESLSQPPVSGRLAGEAVTLIDAVATASSRSEQTAIVAAYWNLSTAITDYYLALRESTEIETSLGGITQPGACVAGSEARPSNASAACSSDCRVGTARIAQAHEKLRDRRPALAGRQAARWCLRNSLRAELCRASNQPCPARCTKRSP